MVGVDIFLNKIQQREVINPIKATQNIMSINTKKYNDFDNRIAAEIKELTPFIHPPCPNPAPLGLL